MKPYKEMTVMKEFFRKNEALKVYQKKKEVYYLVKLSQK